MTTTPDLSTNPAGHSREDAEKAAWAPILALLQHEKRRVALVWQELGLTQPQGYALLHLARLGPSSMASLAATMQCDASNITGLVDKLEARGLIVRKAHPQDRRVKLLVVTEAGEDAQKALRARMAKPPVHFSALTVKDLKRLHDILTKAAGTAPADPTIQ